MDTPSSSPFKMPASPGKPLYALSPERINAQRLPASPSLPSNLSDIDLKHSRTPSDVQSKVAFLNSLASENNTRPRLSTGQCSHAALQRAVLGREEAEVALSIANTQLLESQTRERRVCERMESMMEELQTLKERQIHERQVFEKEIRKARKDAFRASSAMVKIQEDLKEERTESRNLKAEMQHEKFEKEKARQESFERAYTLAGMMEQIELMKNNLKAVEAERDTAIAELKVEQEKAQAANIEIFLPKSTAKPTTLERTASEPVLQIILQQETSDSLLAPRSSSSRPISRQNRFERDAQDQLQRSSVSRWGQRSLGQHAIVDDIIEECVENLTSEERIEDLEGRLRWEQTLRQRAESLMDFVKMEAGIEVEGLRKQVEAQGGTQIPSKAEKKHDPAEGQGNEQIILPIVREGTLDGRSSNEQEFIEIGSTSPINPAQGESIPLLLVDEKFQPVEASAEVAEEEDEDTYPGSRPSDCVQIMQSPHRKNLSPVKERSSLLSEENMTFQLPIRAVPQSPSPQPNTPSRMSVRSAPQTLAEISLTPASARTGSPLASPYPMTPTNFKTPRRYPAQEAHTVTTMVPLRGMEDDDVFSPAPRTPAAMGTPISREAALAQIRARRDRARSLQMSTWKSAPNSARRGLGAGVRDLSAPGSFR